VKSADRHEQAAILQIADIKPANPRSGCAWASYWWPKAC